MVQDSLNVQKDGTVEAHATVADSSRRRAVHRCSVYEIALEAAGRMASRMEAAHWEPQPPEFTAGFWRDVGVQDAVLDGA